MKRPNTDRTPSLQAAARWYAGRGWPIFPCGGKKPLTECGFKDATSDVATIRAWWERWPTANLATATGALSWVLDVDDADALADLEHLHGPLPETWRSITGRGAHVFFAPDTRITTARGALPVGIDVRGHGGYVILPPSLHPETKRSYEWEHGYGPTDLRLAPAPPWLLDLIVHQHGDRLSRDGTPLVIPEGERNARLYRFASLYRRYGLDVAAHLAVTNARHCLPPLAADEVAKIAASAMRHEPSARGVSSHFTAFDADASLQDFDEAVARSLRNIIKKSEKSEDPRAGE